MTAHISEAEYRRIKNAEKSLKNGAVRPWNNYLPKRTDKNQKPLVKFLRELGFMVESLHEKGSGVFDLLTEKHGLNVLVEVKNGSKPPSARKLTPDQKRFHFAWRGMRCVVINETDCLRLNHQINALARKIRTAEIDLKVVGNTEQQYQPGLYV